SLLRRDADDRLQGPAEPEVLHHRARQDRAPAYLGRLRQASAGAHARDQACAQHRALAVHFQRLGGEAVASSVKVLLQTEVENLGSGGDVVRVRAGYARNFLLPRGLAVLATESALKRVDELKRAAAARAAEEIRAAEELSQKLSAMTVRIERIVGDEGKMYGSVTAKDIEDAFERAGVAIDRRRIQLTDPIKQL